MKGLLILLTQKARKNDSWTSSFNPGPKNSDFIKLCGEGFGQKLFTFLFSTHILKYLPVKVFICVVCFLSLSFGGAAWTLALAHAMFLMFLHSS